MRTWISLVAAPSYDDRALSPVAPSVRFHQVSPAEVLGKTGVSRSGRDQLVLIGVVLSSPSLLFLPPLEFMALMRLPSFPLVPFGVGDTFSLVALGPLLICLRHQSLQSS